MEFTGYIGLDVGTSGCKASVIDENGNMLVTARRDYSFESAKRGIVELNPEKVWNSVKEVLREIAVAGCRPKMISVSSIGETMVLLDAHDRIVRNGILYLDERGAETVDYIRDRMGQEEIERITGLPLRFFYSLNRLLWLQKNEPETIEKTSRYFLFGDFITYMLTGERVIDASSASKTFLLDVMERKWSEKIGHIFNIPLEAFSEVVATGMKVGKIRKSLAEETGLPTDLEVIVGSHDQCAASLGSGAIARGDVAAGEGSTESLNLIIDQKDVTAKLLEKKLCLEPYILPDKFLVPAGQHAHGTSIRWFVNEFGTGGLYGGTKEQMAANGKNIFELANEMCAEESEGLFFVPHLTNAHLLDPANRSLGAFVGIDVNANRAKMYRAILEGLCFETKLCLDMLRSTELPVNRIIASGGCAQSPLLMQMKADVLEYPVTVLEQMDAGSMALAMICAVADGVYSDYVEAAQVFVKTGNEYLPQKSYKTKFWKYCQIYDSTKELYTKI